MLDAYGARGRKRDWTLSGSWMCIVGFGGCGCVIWYMTVGTENDAVSDKVVSIPIVLTKEMGSKHDRRNSPLH
jgi:hypothetical protein